ncbi:hypothetical protein COHA_005548 [Chlorella ohadii]|uniref:ELMO domain-containing protein n=1 Tax=Chlorella ohadii TaxID=2649997 RepID=A0AAD5DQL2_9CHLO|nr:hypothetical protein COHA_005548 [Chlorella ohadii]
MGAMPSTLRSRRGASVAPGPIEQPLLSDQLDQQAVPISLRRTAAEQRELPWPLSAVVAAARSVFHAISFAWHSLVGWLHRLCHAEAPQLSLLQQERLSSLRERAAIQFDAEDSAHQDALQQLWRAVFPGSPFPEGVKSEQWKQMGWQSDLPTRDIRGGGLLSLEALVWMAQRQHDAFCGLMEKRAGVRSSWEYPFAAATVNVAFMLIQVLELREQASMDGLPPRSAAARGFVRLLSETDSAFEEVFAIATQLLDAVWLERQASYMEFPGVLKEVQRRLERGLANKHVQSVADLRQQLLPNAP